MMSLRRVILFAVLSSLTACKTVDFQGKVGSKSNEGNGPPAGPPVVPPTIPPVGPPEPIFADCPGALDRMLVASLYMLPENTASLPDFSKMRKVKDVCLKQLDVTDRDFLRGFPGIQDLVEWFALDIHFRLNVPEAGEYKFTLNSDDGSILSIDDQMVIDNDGLHPHQEKSGKFTLTQGWHDMRVRYFEGPRFRIALELFWTKPGASERSYIPTNLFARPLK